MDISWTALLIVIIIGLILIKYTFFGKETHFKKYGIPYLEQHSIFYDVVQIILKKISIVNQTVKTYNHDNSAKYIGYYEFNKPVIMIRDLDILKNITVKNFEHFVDHRNFTDPEIEPLFSNNLFSLKGEKWREIRTLLTPAFTSSKMRAMFKLMSECANNFTDFLVYQSQKGSTVFNSKDIFTRYTNDTIATCAFGVSVDSMKDPNNEFYVLGKKATNFDDIVQTIKFVLMMTFPKVMRLFAVKLFDKRVDTFFSNLVRDTIATRDEKSIYRPDMIQLMMETRNHEPGSKKPELTIESMTSQAFIFFFAGFDTTSTLMCFAAHEIAANTNIQTKLQTEIDHVLESCNGEPTYEAINSMQYLEAVIYEASRLYPVVVAVDRECTKNFELPPAVPGARPYTLEAGSTVILPMWAIHRDPEYYPEPEKFDPNRFLGKEKKNINTSAYFPFGVGPRMCIGNRFALLETKVLFFHLLAKCNIKPAKKMILPMKISSNSGAVTAEGGFWLEINPR
ncbi:cytochrome P450 9e2-like [Microplitis mediator]|uniref:cytochrome P450 9e2-like n=1 Tax=Microplitis mediator TaxID=375433 RepID=UPI00255775C8|nr:cytochrome P450 9e2-like [Microplitis mediator]XP_057326720.1 cytochrome P450 9e2-like [Microplitis mediator]